MDRLARIAQVSLLMLATLPLGSCGYFYFVDYPEVVQRETHGDYSVVTSIAPNLLLWPSLVVGSLHNNTQVTVSLYRGDQKLAETDLISAGDLPSDHLPVGVTWSATTVTAQEPKGKFVTWDLAADGT